MSPTATSEGYAFWNSSLVSGSPTSQPPPVSDAVQMSWSKICSASGSEKAMQVLAGRYGPYVTDGTTHASLPKGADPATVTIAGGRFQVVEDARTRFADRAELVIAGNLLRDVATLVFFEHDAGAQIVDQRSWIEQAAD